MRALFLAALLGVWASPLLASDPPPEKSSGDQTITAVGSGTVTAPPDTAELRLELVTQAASAAAARTDNKTVTERLIRRLEELGIPKKDVKTYPAAAVPQYLQQLSDVQEREVVGYRLTTALRVKVRALDGLDKVLDDLAAQGPNLVLDVRLLVDNQKAPYDEACRKAMADARRKAEAMAREAGVDLGDVLKVEEQQPDNLSSPTTDRKQPKERDYSTQPSPRSGQPPYSADRKRPTEDSNTESAKDDYEVRVTVAVTYAVRPHRKIESKSKPGS